MLKSLLSSKYKILAAFVGLGMLPTVFSNEFQDSYNYKFQPSTELINGIQNCPDTVTVVPQAYGLIVMDWSNYAPNTNAYISVTVVPHTVGMSTVVKSEIIDKGSLTLEGYFAGNYTVSYTLQPISSFYRPCMGIVPKIVFF